MEREYSYKITKKQYDYLLPIWGNGCKNVRLLNHHNGYYFIGTYSDYCDALNRCKYLE